MRNYNSVSVVTWSWVVAELCCFAACGSWVPKLIICSVSGSRTGFLDTRGRLPTHFILLRFFCTRGFCLSCWISLFSKVCTHWLHLFRLVPSASRKCLVGRCWPGSSAVFAIYCFRYLSRTSKIIECMTARATKGIDLHLPLRKMCSEEVSQWKQFLRWTVGLLLHRTEQQKLIHIFQAKLMRES